MGSVMGVDVSVMSRCYLSALLGATIRLSVAYASADSKKALEIRDLAINPLFVVIAAQGICRCLHTAVCPFGVCLYLGSLNLQQMEPQVTSTTSSTSSSELTGTALADVPLGTQLAADPGLLEGLCTTRAIRRYAKERIPDAALRDMLFAATRAPSGSNRQPFRFVVLREGESAEQAKGLIGSAAQEIWRAKRKNDGYAEGSGAQQTSPKARMARTMDNYVDNIATAPLLVLPCLVRYRDPEPMEGASVYPAVQNLLLAARALGYGGVITGFHRPVEAPLKALLGIPEEVFIACTLTIGRPAGNHGPVRRRPMSELVFGDQWQHAPAWAQDPPGTRHTSAGPPARSKSGA